MLPLAILCLRMSDDVLGAFGGRRLATANGAGDLWSRSVGEVPNGKRGNSFFASTGESISPGDIPDGPSRGVGDNLIQGNADWVILPEQSSYVHPELPFRPFSSKEPTLGILDVGDFNDGLVKLKSGKPIPPGAKIDVVGLSEDALIGLKHVEGHAAAIMRANDIPTANLHINYIGGPCRFCRGQTSATGIHEILLPGQRLDITYPLPDGNIGRGYFVGGPDGGFVDLLPDF